MNKMIRMWRQWSAGVLLAGFVGTAVPQGLAQTAADEVAAQSARGFVGITLSGQIHEAGAVIGDVRADFPAAQAGMRAGDVIVGFQGKPVDDSQSLYARMRTLRPGEAVDIEYLRDGQRHSSRMAAVDREGRAASPVEAGAKMPEAASAPAARQAPASVIAAAPPAVTAAASRMEPKPAAPAAPPSVAAPLPEPAVQPRPSAAAAAIAQTEPPAAPAAATSSHAESRAASRAVDIDKARSAFALMDRQDFLDGIEEANQCTARQNYDCADRSLARVKELIAEDDEQRLWDVTRAGVQDGRRMLAEQRAAEERQRQWELAQQEEEERQEEARRQQQTYMAFTNALQTFQSEMQSGLEQQRQQQEFLQNLQAQARAQQEAQRRQQQAEAAEQARQRAQQQQAAREALAAQLASGMAYRNQQMTQTTNAADRQRLQNDNTKAMQAAQQIGMASEVGSQADAQTRTQLEAAQAQRQAAQQAEQQRLAEQRRVEQERQAAQRAEQQRIAAEQAAAERKRKAEEAEAERQRQAEQRRLAAEQAERDKKQAYQDWLAAKKRGMRLGAKSCDGKDQPYRLIGDAPSVPLPKSINYYSECITVKYEARCPGTPRGAGLFGSQYNFTGLGLGCLSAESQMSRRLACKDDEVIVDVVDVVSCGG